MPKLVKHDPSWLFLLPPDIRDWAPVDVLALLVLEARWLGSAGGDAMV